MTDSHSLDSALAYDYELPLELIAHKPAETRSASRLMVVAPDAGCAIHPFAKLDSLLQEGDLLVFNNTKVLPCRLFATKPTGGGVEVFVLEAERPDARETTVRVMTKSNKRLKPGVVLTLSGASGAVKLVEPLSPGIWSVTYTGEVSLAEAMEQSGQMPLPPYIVKRRKDLGLDLQTDSDRNRYQTIYAEEPGAVAAPTAGLHFDEALFESLDQRGIRRAFVTLHVGIGTFKPLDEEAALSSQTLHTETYVIDDALAEAIRETKARGGRVISVGTTSTRALEDQAARFGTGQVQPGHYATSIFIRPGDTFGLIDGMITNLHLPKSSLLVLVSALSGHATMMEAYTRAVAESMRFYSYGDAMLLLPNGLNPAR